MPFGNTPTRNQQKKWKETEGKEKVEINKYTGENGNGF